MNNLKDIIGGYESFLQTLLKEMAQEGFDMSDFVQLDHLCYRASSAEQYEVKKQACLAFGTLLDEITISGRRIAVMRLNTPISFQGWRIDVLEIAAPKPNTSPTDGLDHAEFVIFDSQDAFLKKYAGKTFDLKSVNRGVNPEICFTLPSGRVKFHLLNIATAVYLQNKLGITEL